VRGRRQGSAELVCCGIGAKRFILLWDSGLETGDWGLWTGGELNIFYSVQILGVHRVLHSRRWASLNAKSALLRTRAWQDFRASDLWRWRGSIGWGSVCCCGFTLSGVMLGTSRRSSAEGRYRMRRGLEICDMPVETHRAMHDRKA
jgi:hypothetical protein